MTRAWLAAAVLLLAACAPVAVRPPVAGDADLLAAQSAREAALAAQRDWSLAGRLAVSANGDGGSGRIEWTQRGDDYRIVLSAPVTRRSWVLDVRGGEAVLSGLDGGDRRSHDAEALLHDATGWRIPVAALAAWARGARASGPAQFDFTPDGLPSTLQQQGWQVEYRDWLAGEPALPRRVFARQGEASVRLVVERWERP